MHVKIKILNKQFYNEESNGMLLNPLPSYATPGSVAVDLIATEDYTLPPKYTMMVSTGLAIHIGTGAGVMGVIAPRSGLGRKGLVLTNTIGVIDEDYQGELLVSAVNNSVCNSIVLKAGDRFAQLIFVKIVKAEWVVVDEFDTVTERGNGGFGSTGN